MKSIPILLSIWCLCGSSIVFGEKSPIVQTKNGTLEGTFMLSRKGRQFASFRGIPYAQPPVGELRFEPPKPFGSWTGVRSAKEDSNICTQQDIFSNIGKMVGVEDCLYLNVYTPELPSNNIDPFKMNYPVMIWIHGGGWTSGSSNSTMYGPKFMLDHDVILVTVNYRVGVLGFFSTEDLVSPGNQGLKDQTLAIKWVNENIAAFKGDPNRITIFGESAGGASIHYHMISPLSRGLFQRAISQSGAVLNPWAMNRPGNPKNITNKIGKLLDCPTNESSALVKCLKKKNAVDILNSVCLSQNKQVLDQCNILSSRPAIEPDHPGAFIKEEPAQSLKSGRIADVPWLAGTNSHEGALVVAGIYGLTDGDYVKLLDEKFMEIAPRALLYDDTCPEKSIHNVTKSIREFYLGDKKIDEATRWTVIDMFTDAWFYIGTDNVVRDHLAALSSPVYYYYFAYRGSSSFSIKFGDAKRDYGVVHADEFQYLFPVGELIFAGTPMNEEDLRIVDIMTSLWFNFAKSGNPTPVKTPEIPVKWKPVRTSNLEYLHIGNSKDLRMTDNLHRDRVNFWSSIPHRGKIEINEDDN